MPSYYPMHEYKFIKFKKSNSKGKKYDAILQHKQTQRHVSIPFGDQKFQQFFDSTGLGLYSHKDHKDKERRRRYIARHNVFIKPNMYSAGYYSLKFLW